jgi:hypothetical protein
VSAGKTQAFIAQHVEVVSGEEIRPENDSISLQLLYLIPNISQNIDAAAAMSQTRYQGPEHLQPHQIEGLAVDDLLGGEHFGFD